MAWVKGQSGNPGGRGTEKLFASAVREAINVVDVKARRRKLQLIAEKLVEHAMEGQPWAIAQVADRLDGKPSTDAVVTNVGNVRELSDATLLRIAARGAEKDEAPDGSSKPN